MKLILVVVAVLGLTNALPQRSLRDELQDFIDLLPRDDMVALVKTAYARGDFDAILAYVQTDEFKAAVEKVRASQELQEFVAFLEEKGVDVEVLKEWVRAIIGLLPLDAELAGTTVETRAFADFWAEFKELIPTAEIKALWIEKRENSAVIQQLIETLKSDRVSAYVNRVWNLEAVQSVVDKLRNRGYDVDRVLAWIREHLGW